MASFSAWPITAKTTAELPPPLDVQLAEQLACGESIRHLVYVPADDSAWRQGRWARTRGVQVLALTDQRIIMGVQAVRAGEATWVALPYNRVLTWEIEQVLLYGRLRIWGDLEGQVVHSFIEFNTVGCPQIEEALTPLETTTLGSDRRTVTGRARPWPTAADLPFKFNTFLGHALLQQEQMLGMIFQEFATEPMFWVWRRLITPGTVIVGTDRRLLVIREQAQLREARYGHTALSMPRRWADNLAIRDAGDWLFLEYAPSPDVLSLPVPAAHASVLQALIAALQSGTAEHVSADVDVQAVGKDVVAGYYFKT